jgi:hypothetical protein
VSISRVIGRRADIINDADHQDGMIFLGVIDSMPSIFNLNLHHNLI